jgi:hypothetical protein
VEDYVRRWNPDIRFLQRKESVVLGSKEFDARSESEIAAVERAILWALTNPRLEHSGARESHGKVSR